MIVDKDIEYFPNQAIHKGQCRAGQVFGNYRVLGWISGPKTTAKWLAECIKCSTKQSFSKNDIVFLKLSKHGCFNCVDLKGHKSNTWQGGSFISATYYGQLKRNAEIRGIVFDDAVTIRYLEDLFLSQGTICAYSGRALNFENKTASVDRIDSSLGYQVGNLEWVHKDVNVMKWATSKEDFINLCKEIAAKHSDDPENNLESWDDYC